MVFNRSRPWQLSPFQKNENITVWTARNGTSNELISSEFFIWRSISCGAYCRVLISILTYFILEEKRIGIRIGQYESSQQISCGFSKTKIRYFLSISNIYVLFQCVFIMTHNFDSWLWLIVFLLFIYFHWSLLVKINIYWWNQYLCVPKNHFQCVIL